MSDSVQVSSLVQGESHKIRLDRLPDECPRCQQGIDPRFRFGALLERLPARELRAELVFQCPRENCRRLFLAMYGHETPYARETIGSLVFKFIGAYPYNPMSTTFSDRLAQVSPQFTEIYNQASAAEHYELAEVAGPGYRKALEFLVKDYLISLSPADAEQIKATLLGPLIQERVSDANIKAVAERATWLGNDETHYERRWENKDIGDLKKLIGLTVYWIDSELMTKDLVGSMPAPAKRR